MTVSSAGLVDAADASRVASAFDGVVERGRKLVSNHDGVVAHDPPFALACECQGLALDLAVRRISLVALALSAIISAIVATGAAPLPILAIALVWTLGAVGARLFARARRREHGRMLLDFEHDTLLHAPRGGPARRIALGRETRISTENSVDEGAPFWLVLTAPGGEKVRLARGRAEELLRVVQLFKSYQYKVDASWGEASEAD